jgi:hypothetical protein
VDTTRPAHLLGDHGLGHGRKKFLAPVECHWRRQRPDDFEFIRGQLGHSPHPRTASGLFRLALGSAKAVELRVFD